MNLNKTISILLLFLTSLAFCQSCAESSVQEAIVKYKTGDIIFHESTSGQGRAVQIATGSKYSHVGLILKENDNWVVIEAVQPVRIVSLDDFIAHGDGNRFVVKRLKVIDSSIDLSKCINEAKTYLGKNYDAYFEWSDEKIYCSELVYKAYDRALGIELCGKEKIRDMNLSNPIVAAKLRERYGDDMPMDEDVITPACLFNSDKLVTVMEK